MTDTDKAQARSWGEEWRQLQKQRRHADDSSYWDKRAANFGRKDMPNPYVDRFLELAAIKSGESVLDMGCGTGALSIPLGEAGHPIVAADFSRGMLDILEAELARHEITCVTPKLMSWEDDWDAFGVKENSVDVCVASRSIAVVDLEEALLKLTRTARRRVCITLPTGSSPRVDERILAVAGFNSTAWRDYLYAFNILAEHGIKAEVRYIESTRYDSFASFEEAFDKHSQMIRESDAGRVASAAELELAEKRLHTWLAGQLVQNERAGMPDGHGATEGALRLREPRTVSWAFLSWNK